MDVLFYRFIEVMGLRNIVIQGSLSKVFVHVFILTASQIL